VAQRPMLHIKVIMPVTARPMAVGLTKSELNTYVFYVGKTQEAALIGM